MFKNKIVRSLLLIFVISTISVSTTSFVSNDFQISKHMEIFANLVKKLHVNYVDEIKAGDLVKTGIDAMLEKLDPYTVYIPESEIEDVQMMTTGEYGGIGSTIQKRGDYVQIAKIYEGFPADKGNLKPGDKILKVEEKDVKGKSTEEVSNLLKGQSGSEIDVTIQRPEEDNPRTITLKRKKIKLDNIPYSNVLENSTGYIKLSRFTKNAADEVKEEFENLKETNELNGIIIDLRNNGGGLLNEAVEIVNLFVPKGKVVVKTKGKLESKNNTYRTTREPVDTTIPLAILVNENSASASEIVSGAIQDLDRGVIIGETTYGKGLVQNIVPLSYNTRMKVTVAKYYIPSGRCIQSVDYSNEENQTETTPDSLMPKFKTKNGRIVYDAKGIIPDKIVKSKEYKQISRKLISDHLVFDFATEFYYQKDSIPAPEQFAITDNIYQDFAEFLNKKDFSYKTKTEQKLESLKETAEDEMYLESIEKELENLKNELHHDKDNDLKKFRPEIEKLLLSEITGRYYYQKGEIISGLKDDKQTDKAVSLLKDKEAYKKILTPSIN
ncbi:MAG: S41 family peptidase [Bacteroidota bacterium]